MDFCFDFHFHSYIQIERLYVEIRAKYAILLIEMQYRMNYM